MAPLPAVCSNRTKHADRREDQVQGEERRRFERYPLTETFEVYANGLTLELPTNDISQAGVQLDSCNYANIRTGEVVIVALPTGDDIACRVVRCDRDRLQLEFLSSPSPEVDYLLRLRGVKG